MCVRHDRNTQWPICEPEDWLHKHLATPLRHPIEDVPPYNYKGIDESIHNHTMNTVFNGSGVSGTSGGGATTMTSPDEYAGASGSGVGGGGQTIQTATSSNFYFNESSMSIDVDKVDAVTAISSSGIGSDGIPEDVRSAAPTPPPSTVVQSTPTTTTAAAAVPASTPVNTPRSATLPDAAAAAAVRRSTSNFIKQHTRSLSETKPMTGGGGDGAGISLTSTSTAGHHHCHTVTSSSVQHHRTRFNSGTDSNTSGVSSCESVYGGGGGGIGGIMASRWQPLMMNIDGVLQNTLSPIPSSSNLLEVKKRPATGERFRRISLTGASFRENTLSPQDVKGYAQLRKLRSKQRPMLSESAAGELAEFIDSKLSVDMQRRMKVRSLDRHFKLQ